MLIGLMFFVRRNRAQARTAEPNLYQVEESQVQGPPVMRETQYTPASGPVGVYEKEGESRSAVVEPTFPRPEPAVYPEHRAGSRDDYYYGSPRTAPVTRVRFAEDLREGGSGSQVVSVVASCCHRDA